MNNKNIGYIEAGWALLVASHPEWNPDSIEYKERRKMFFCGAYHLFDVMMSISNNNSESLAEVKLTSVENELKAFHTEVTILE